jgi:uncharacterized protein YndB with AHSA1/START domain
MGGEQWGGEARVMIAAPPAAVWLYVSDVTRVGQWSPECLRGTYLDGATTAAEGVRFRGATKRGFVRRVTNCTVVRFEPERAIAWEVRPPYGGAPTSLWTYELTPVDGGTEVVESFKAFRATILTRVGWVLMGGKENRREMLHRSVGESLAKLKTLVESQPVAAG